MNRFLSLFCASAFGAALVFSATGASAAEICVSDSAKTSLNACTGSAKDFNVTQHGKAPQVNFHSAPPPADLKKRDQQTRPNAPSVEQGAASRDDRRARLQARGRALLVTEIQGVESLFAGTPANSPDRIDLERRLAEDYVELESAAFRDKTQAEIDRDGLKKTNPSAAGQKQTLANQADVVMKRARERAEFYYTKLKTEYPNYGKLDEVLYYLAYEYEQGSEFEKARPVYYELIQKRPDSKYIPNAYLAFGELFFNQAQGDPSKFDLAAKAYIEVVKYPPPKNGVYGYALYKLAYVYWNTGELDKALNAFKKTIDYGVAYAQQPNAAKLAEAARKDIIPVYALKGDPGAAYNFFHGLSGDQAGQNDKTFKMMDDLGNNYLDTGHYPEAIALYRDLMARDKSGEKSCVYQAHITEATMAMKSGNKDAIKAELDNQTKIYSDFKNSNHQGDAKQECANKTAALMSETAMAWHLEAVGSGGQRGTGDQRTMTLAAYLYKRVTELWNAQEFASFQFPRIVKDDWPTIYKIKYAMADLLYFQENWGACGPAFDSVVAENPQAAEAAEAAYASVLCYQKIYDQTHAHGEGKKGSGNLPGQKPANAKAQKEDEDAKLKPKDFSDGQKGMISAFNKYICYIKPAANDTAGQDQLVEVKYARARTYFEAQHWEEAGLAFREIAMDHADKDVGIYAAQLYLESVNVLGSHSNPPRPACFDDMAADVPKFLELYCTGANAAKNQEQCTSLNKVQVDILRLKAQKLVERADKGTGPAALKDYEDAGNAYFEMYRRYCQDPVASGQLPQADRCDEIVYNSARAFQAARLLAKAITARRALLEFDAKTNMHSPLAKKATYEIGGNYQAIAVYDLAADWFEKYQKADAHADKADAALSDAVLLRLGLGQEDQAIEDARVFTRNYGASKPKETAQIAFAVGAHYADAEQWDKARGALSGSMGVIDKAPPDVTTQAHATLARAYANLKKVNESKGEYAKVRGIWKDAGAAESAIRTSYSTEDAASQDKRLAKALTAVGEAYFAQAEEQRHTLVDPVKFPEYKGPGTKDDVLKHINTKVKDWYEKKRAAIEKVEPSYVEILNLKPVPPPKWVIAAGSRSGLMWGDLVDDFRRAPIPEAWKKDAEIRGTYYDALDAASEPFKVQHAKPALKKCLDLSVQYQYFDEYSRSCEVWLAKNYKAEYHVVDEIRPAPTLSNSGLDERLPPVLNGGAFYHPQATTVDKSSGGSGGSGDNGASSDASGGSSDAAAAAPAPKPAKAGKSGRKH